jgi:hypothetical protein
MNERTGKENLEKSSKTVENGQDQNKSKLSSVSTKTMNGMKPASGDEEVLGPEAELKKDYVWGEDPDVYPLREKHEDPTWAVRTVWIWTGFALASLVFTLTFLILGIFYD